MRIETMANIRRANGEVAYIQCDNWMRIEIYKEQELHNTI